MYSRGKCFKQFAEALFFAGRIAQERKEKMA